MIVFESYDVINVSDLLYVCIVVLDIVLICLLLYVVLHALQNTEADWHRILPASHIACILYLYTTGYTDEYNGSKLK